MRFIEGACYFLVGYYDEELLLPFVQTYIYLGRNVLGDAGHDSRWYFQEAESFVRNGRVVPRTGRKNEDILISPSDHLEDFLSYSQLAELLRQLAVKAGGRHR